MLIGGVHVLGQRCPPACRAEVNRGKARPEVEFVVRHLAHQDRDYR